MASRITATEAARNFSDLLNRVKYQGESLEVERGGEVVARIEPAPRKAFTLGDLAQWAREQCGVDVSFAADLESARKAPSWRKPWGRR